MNKIKLTIILIAAAILLTACQDKESGKLDNRVLAFWNHKINKEFKSAYQYLSPGWRASESKESYKLRMLQSKINWIEAQMKSKKCSAKDICKVVIEIKYEYRFKGAINEMMSIDTKVIENWIMKDNSWYNLPIKKKINER